MKGKLEKTIKGQWVVRIISEETPECDTIIEHGKQFPVHPEYVKYYFLDEDADGSEVEFEIVNKLWGTNDDIISYAKLKKPEMGNKVDLQKLEAKLDKILADETPESFHEWLERKTGPIRSYHSPKIDGMLKEIEEDDVKKLAEELYPIEFHPIMEGSYDINREQREAFVKGYNKAKETLYTEEELKRVYTRGYDRGIDRKPRNMEAYIEFIKQNKKD